ncbi:DUF952 domain-containing protein [Frankia gtarii]|uniref:DUF952 domain-containing protein n=1 Tax=Frankia gtarii TaxID=2950102 RepID=UPI0021BED805|nr:DUF952 domain-containing protein [Frankia gtarii]
MICHLVGRTAWSVGAAGYRPVSLGTEGFIHFSTPEQIVGTANRFYAGRDDLLLVVVDPQRLTAPLRWEPPAAVVPAAPVATASVPPAAATASGPATGELFPHLYGPIDAGAVAAVIPFPPGSDGTFSVPPTLW